MIRCSVCQCLVLSQSIAFHREYSLSQCRLWLVSLSRWRNHSGHGEMLGRLKWTRHACTSNLQLKIGEHLVGSPSTAITSTSCSTRRWHTTLVSSSSITWGEAMDQLYALHLASYISDPSTDFFETALSFRRSNTFWNHQMVVLNRKVKELYIGCNDSLHLISIFHVFACEKLLNISYSSYITRRKIETTAKPH